MNEESSLTLAAPGNVGLVSAPMTCDVHQAGIDISVSAETREGIAAGQRQLVEWCDRKIADLERELHESEANLEEARRGNWNMAPFRRAIARFEKQIVYYRKMKGAFLEGFVLVPNFPLSIFAIRTDRKAPLEVATFYRWADRSQNAQSLPQGEGEYRNPQPLQDDRQVLVEEKGKTEEKTEWRATDWQDDLDFPLVMAKPHLMAAVNRAQALKLFDEIGILPNPLHRMAHGDPLICGTIICGHRERRSRRRVTFMVAWHVDTRTL